MCNYYRDEVNDDANENNADRNKINKNKTITSKSFECKATLIGRTPNNKNILDAKVIIPLKYSGNFWRTLDFPIINCEIEHDLIWSKEYIIPEILLIFATAGNPNARLPVQAREVAIQQTSATFQINKAKLYVPVVTLSTNDNIKF